MTREHRGRSIAGRALLTLVLAVAATATAQESHGETDARRIAVVGRAEIEAQADMATVQMAVVHTAAEVTTARDRVGEVVGRFLSLVDELGIDREDVTTSGVRVVPEYRRQRTAASASQPELIGYRVSRDLVVELHDLERLGTLVERALSLGANQASPPSFGVSNEDELQLQALERAAENARARAKVLADTLGAALGPVYRIEADEIGVRPPVREVYARAAMSSDAGAAENTYDPGKVTIEARARVVFDLVAADAAPAQR